MLKYRVFLEGRTNGKTMTEGKYFKNSLTPMNDKQDFDEIKNI